MAKPDTPVVEPMSPYDIAHAKADSADAAVLCEVWHAAVDLFAAGVPAQTQVQQDAVTRLRVALFGD